MSAYDTCMADPQNYDMLWVCDWASFSLSDPSTLLLLGFIVLGIAFTFSREDKP